MDRDNLITILKGMWIGGTMTVPGVSGGSMAMILGVYDRLISSVSSFLRIRERACPSWCVSCWGQEWGWCCFPGS